MAPKRKKYQPLIEKPWLRVQYIDPELGLKTEWFSDYAATKTLAAGHDLICELQAKCAKVTAKRFTDEETMVD